MERNDGIAAAHEELNRLAAFPGYGDRTITATNWTTKDGRRLRALLRPDGYLNVRDVETGRDVEHGTRVNTPFILSMWPSRELAAERAECADLDEAGELDELADEIEEAWAGNAGTLRPSPTCGPSGPWLR